MRKFIHSDFEIDLSPYSITFTWENPWFSGEYFTKYSLPFTMAISDELDMAMGFLSHHNSVDAVTLFKGTFVDGDVMEDAELEVEELQTDASTSLRYGESDFPSFQTKLAELPLHQAEVANIYEHAEDTITKAWPEVNYNFPQVHIDKIDTDSEEWTYFEKIINNYKDGAFLVNDVDLENDVSYNRNIIQPLPYLLHVLQAGFAAAGRTLTGDVLSHPLLAKILLYTDTTYYNAIDQESIDVLYASDEYDTIDLNISPPNYPKITLNKSLEIVNPGKYRITGTVRVRVINKTTIGWLAIKYRNHTIYSTYQSFLANSGYWLGEYEVDVTFETLTDLDPNYLYFEYIGGFKTNDMLFDLAVNPIRLHDDSGNAMASVINLNEVNLKRAVPDMTFGELVKLTLEMFKMDLTTTDTEARINFVSTEMASAAIIDLSGFEVKRPKRTYSKGNSYLVKYEDASSDDYTYDVIYQDAEGAVTAGYTKSDKTTEVTFNALPLPLLYRNSVLTAHGFLEDNAKPMFVLYNGLVGGINIAQSPAPLLMPALHSAYLEQWMAQRIDAVGYEWTFLAYTEELEGLTAKSRVYAYKNIHIVKSLEKTSLKPGLSEVKLTTEVFKL